MNITVEGLDEVIKQLEKLSDKTQVDEIAKRAVNAALPALHGSVSSHIHPRDVAGGVVTKDAKVNSYGVFGVVTVTGHNAKGESNAKRANILEHGTSRTPAKPWRAASASAVREQCMQTMEKILESEMGLE